MLLFAVACSFAFLWGLAENRLFKELGEWRFLGHFKTYHVFLALLILLVSFLGAEGFIRKFAFLTVWSPWMLDVVWWVKRYWDFKHGFGASYGEPNAWHDPLDWDNAPFPLIKLDPLRIEYYRPPLVLGCYWWWWVCGFLCVVLGGLMLL